MEDTAMESIENSKMLLDILQILKDNSLTYNQAFVALEHVKLLLNKQII